MRPLVPWLAVIVVSAVVHAISAVAGWSDLATYAALVAVGFPVTAAAAAWVDGVASWGRRDEPRASHLG